MFAHLIKTHEADLQIKHPEFPAIGMLASYHTIIIFDQNVFTMKKCFFQNIFLIEYYEKLKYLILGLVFEAIWQERFDLVKILVENGVDINKKIFLNQIQNGEFHVLHAAILFEFKRLRFIMILCSFQVK